MFFKKGYCFDEMRLTFFSTWDAEAILDLKSLARQGPPCSPPCSPKLNLRSCESGMQVGCLELFRNKNTWLLGADWIAKPPVERPVFKRVPPCAFEFERDNCAETILQSRWNSNQQAASLNQEFETSAQKYYRVPRNEKNHQKIKNHRNMILNPKTCPHFSNWSS